LLSFSPVWVASLRRRLRCRRRRRRPRQHLCAAAVVLLLLLLLCNLRSEVCGVNAGGGRLVDGRRLKRGLTAAG